MEASLQIDGREGRSETLHLPAMAENVPRLRTTPGLTRGACVLLALGLTLVGCGRSQDQPDAESRLALGAVPECEREGYPCAWSEVDIAVGRRIHEVSDMALDTMYQQSPTALWRWLQTVPDLADAGVEPDSAAVWFRLEGARRVYVMAPHPRHAESRPSGDTPPSRAPSSPGVNIVPLHAGVGDGLGRWLAGAVGLGSNPTVPGAGSRARVPAEVAGRDRNGDSRVNQRDQRRALVLAPTNFEHCYDSIEDRYPDLEQKRIHRDEITAICEGRASPATLGLTSADLYAHGERVAQTLDAIPAYQGNVVLLKDQAAGLAVIPTFGDYDVIHLATHGAENIWAFGDLVPWPEGDNWAPSLAPGLFLVVFKAGQFGPKRATYGVDEGYFRAALENGLGRTFLFASACETLGDGRDDAPPLVDFMAGTQGGVLGWKIQVPYDASEFLSVQVHDLLSRGWTVGQALDSLILRRSESLNGPPGAEDQFYLQATDLADHGKDLRIFEIPELMDPVGMAPGGTAVPLRDGPYLGRILAGAPGDGRKDTVTVDVDVRAITEVQTTGTSVHLELDQHPIGSPQALSSGTLVAPNRYRVQFQGVGVEKDLELDTDYEFEAVVALPEGGESRQAVRLRAETCLVPEQGDYEGRMRGVRARVVERGDRGSFAKILADPRGGWYLQLESRELGDRDLSIGVSFDETPSEGGAAVVFSGGLLDGKIGGSVDQLKGGRNATNWFRGAAELRFDVVKPQEGKPFQWVCGTISARLVGLYQTSGDVLPVEVLGDFEGSFRAEWYDRR